MSDSSTAPARSGGMTTRRWIALGVGALIAIGIYNFIGVFVVQPIGALPNGVTAVLFRRSAVLHFIDSPDAICEREQGGVSLLCRGITAGAVAKYNPVLISLPYSDLLYSWTVSGKSYDR